MARIFISYRRGETRWAAGRIYDRLVEKLGKESAFLDVTDIEPGEDFSDKIGQIIARCDVLLVVMGPTWLTLTDRAGKRRLDDPQDLLRIEIAAALKRNIRVIPVLLDETVMPQEQDLPEDLAALARRNAREISYNRFHSDLDSLIRVLERVLAIPATPPLESTAAPSPVAPRYTETPFTISIETLGGVATPLIARGARLPASYKEAFSTAEDNQSAVTIHLFAGERAIAAENVAIGRFELSSIPPAPKGVPQLTLQASVDSTLVLTVSIKDEATGRTEVLDAVDLTRVELPPGASQIPAQPASPRDSSLDLSAAEKSGNESWFKDIFGELFSDKNSPPTLDLTTTLTVRRSEIGREQTLDLSDGRRVQFRVPTPTKGNMVVLRFRGMGAQAGKKSGDLYLNITVKD
jgi:Hsp70 protein/TIR domain